MAIIVDTHKIYAKLMEAGFETAKANAIVESFGMAQDDLVTKQDIELLRKDLTIQMWSIATVIIGVMAAFNFFD